MYCRETLRVSNGTADGSSAVLESCNSSAILLGHFWAIIFEPLLLGHYWAIFGPLFLDPYCWVIIGPFLGHFWAIIFGPLLLGHYWAIFGPFLAFQEAFLGTLSLYV